MTPHAERHPSPQQPWTPASHEWARRAAREACEAAVRKAKDARKQPITEETKSHAS